jgi:hypothetical protein
MMNHNDPFLTIDRAHELAGELTDDFDKALATATGHQARAMRQNALIGHQQTLQGLAESLALRLSCIGVTEQLVRSAISCGPLLAGQMLLDLIGKCIADDAETAALVEMDRESRAGGLDLAAMLRADVNVNPAFRAAVAAVQASRGAA